VAAQPGVLVTFTVAANDPNAAETVALRLNGPGTLTPLASGTSASGRYDWTPAAGDAGDHVVEFVASDACGGESRCAVTIAVAIPQPDNRAPDCSGAHAEPSVLWPPNKALVPVSIVGITDPDGDPVSVQVVRIVQDEPVGNEANCADAVIANGSVSVRAERDGGGDGRVYELRYRAVDARGAACEGAVRVCVGNDGHVDCSAGTLAYNSLGPCAPNPVRSAKVKSQRLEARVVRATRAGAEIEYSLPNDTDVMLAVFDLAGRRVASIETGRRTAGVHVASWTPGGSGRGVFFYRLTTPERSLTGPIVVQD